MGICPIGLAFFTGQRWMHPHVCLVNGLRCFHGATVIHLESLTIDADKSVMDLDMTVSQDCFHTGEYRLSVDCDCIIP